MTTPPKKPRTPLQKTDGSRLVKTGWTAKAKAPGSPR